MFFLDALQGKYFLLQLIPFLNRTGSQGNQCVLAATQEPKSYIFNNILINGNVKSFKPFPPEGPPVYQNQFFFEVNTKLYYTVCLFIEVTFIC